MRASAPAPATTPPLPATASASINSSPRALTVKLPNTRPAKPLAVADTVELLLVKATATPAPTNPTPTPVDSEFMRMASLAMMATSPVAAKVAPLLKVTVAVPLLLAVAPAPCAPKSKPPPPATALAVTLESPWPSTALTSMFLPLNESGPLASTCTEVSTSDRATDTPMPAPRPTETPKA